MRNLQTPNEAQTYLKSLFPKEPSGVAEARANAEQLHKEGISLSHAEAQMISFLVRSKACKKFVEIGTLTGASGLWILQGLEVGGTLWTFEKDPQHAVMAKSVLEPHASQSEKKCFVIEGDAELTLESISQYGPFDGILIDGNKAAYGRYLDWAEKNLKKGALILADNVFLGGSVWGEKETPFSEKQAQVMRSVNERLADPSRYDSVLIPTSEGLFAAIKKF